MRKCILLSNEYLLPPAWRFMLGGPIWAFNPGILKNDDHWILAYRIVGVDQMRRIGMCRLDKHYRIIEGSQVAFSDLIVVSTADNRASFRRWFADPRLYRLAGRSFLYWNSGWHEPKNFQYLQEFDPDKFTPIGQVREMVLDGPRQPLEKNWSLFGNGPFYAVYSIVPHRILEFTIDGDSFIEFKDAVSVDWSAQQYCAEYGKLRGGAPPIRIGDIYYSFCHSLYSLDEGLCYTPTVYCFSSAYSFRPVRAPQGTLKLGNPFGSSTVQKRLNPVVAEVLYPCGAEYLDGHFIVSHGINDEHCAISILPEEDITSLLANL